MNTINSNLSFREEALNKKGETKKFEKDYRFFNAGKTNLENHQELLYITKVK